MQEEKTLEAGINKSRSARRVSSEMILMFQSQDRVKLKLEK